MTISFFATLFFPVGCKALPLNIKERKVALCLKGFNFPQIARVLWVHTQASVLHEWKSVLLKAKTRNICVSFYSMGHRFCNLRNSHNCAVTEIVWVASVCIIVSQSRWGQKWITGTTPYRHHSMQGHASCHHQENQICFYWGLRGTDRRAWTRSWVQGLAYTHSAQSCTVVRFDLISRGGSHDATAKTLRCYS
jgi:hypothetical protein